MLDWLSYLACSSKSICVKFNFLHISSTLHQISSLTSNKHGGLNKQGGLAEYFFTSHMKKFKEGGLFSLLNESA